MVLAVILTSPAYADDGSNSTENHNDTLNSSGVVENHLNRSYYLDNYSKLLADALRKNREIRSNSTPATSVPVTGATVFPALVRIKNCKYQFSC